MAKSMDRYREPQFSSLLGIVCNLGIITILTYTGTCYL